MSRFSVVALSAAAAFAQINTATLTGTVQDSLGGKVPGAQVVVEENTSHTVRSTQTNSTGVYNLPLLQPGAYTITISKQGFATLKNTSMQLEVSQVATYDGNLQVASSAQSVTVGSALPLIDTSTAGLGTVIGEKETAELPLNGRQFSQLLQLAPGTAPVSVSQSTAPTIGSGSYIPSINGGSNRSDLFFIDGIYATDPFFSTFSISPSVDALQEFKEQTHTDLAEFGQVIGGTVNIAAKAGTNSFHGEAYEFLRNDALDARYFFAPTRGAYRQNQFGGTIGGPIIRNKLFFFGFYDGYRFTQAANNFTIVPTQAELNGNFSAAPNTIYDPATYNPSTGTISAFPGNQIPAYRFNQGMLNYLKAFVPLPNFSPSSNNSNNYLNTEPGTTNQDQGGVRVDYQLSEKDSLNGHYMVNRSPSDSPGSLPNNGFISTFDTDNIGINWTHVISPTLVTQVTVGYNKQNTLNYYIQNNALATFESSGLNQGFTAQPGGTEVPKVPGIGVEGYFGVSTGWGGLGPMTVGQLDGTTSKTLGNHSLKFGASYYRTWLYTNWAQDNESFGHQATWDPTTNTGGDGFAAMLLGLPGGASRELGNSAASERSYIFGTFVQDTWRVNKKLAVNYGLRWDYTDPSHEKYNRYSTFDIATDQWILVKGDRDTPSVLPAGVRVLNRNTITAPDYLNFSPRLGLAYQLSPTTVVRAGFGIFYDNWSGALQASQNSRGTWPSGASQGVGNLNIAGITPGVTAQNPFFGQTLAPPSSPFPTSGDGFLALDFKDSYSPQWNFQVQQQVGKSSKVSLAYVGSSTVRAPIEVPFNSAVTPGPGAIYPRQPYQNMSSPDDIGISTFSMIQSIGRRSYNSAQASFDRRFSNGLFFISSFTWSKNIDIGCASYWEACTFQNPYNLNGERGPSALDIPLVFSLSGGYELPFGKGKPFLNSNRFGKAILGGWQLNGIFSAHSGTPFNTYINFDNANVGGGSQRPNVVADWHLSNPTLGEYFNTSAFQVAAPYTFGDVGRNSMRGPGAWNLDSSIFRTFDFFEKVHLQFRGEFFNTFNHMNWGNPGTTLNNPGFGQIT